MERRVPCPLPRQYTIPLPKVSLRFYNIFVYGSLQDCDFGGYYVIYVNIWKMVASSPRLGVGPGFDSQGSVNFFNKYCYPDLH